MKLTAILLFTACLQVSANTYSQTITLRVENAPLDKVVKEIEKQSKFNFFYKEGLFQNANPVTISVSKSTLQQTLDALFNGQPFEYKIVQNTVFVKGKQDLNIGQATINIVDDGELNGHVANNKGEPLVGANISVKRTGKGTITDADGDFKLFGVLNGDLIIISYVGYQPQSVRISDQSDISLVLSEANNELDQVVMQGYGQTTRRLATGNIAKITSEEIGKQPIINPLQALQGRVPGLIITQTNGYGSAPFKVEIRGRKTIDSKFTSEPLYVIDGVPLTVLELSSSSYASGSKGYIQNGMATPSGGQSPFFSINPADIESIEVLKDADATAIYGSRGANGVILVTTKKGKPGRTKFDVSAYQGFSKVTRYWDMLNTNQYIRMRKEAFFNDSVNLGIVPDQSNAYDFLVWDTARYTNWQKYLWGGTGKTTDIQTGLSGGDYKTHFRIAAGMHHQTDILAKSGADQRASISFNVNHTTLNQKVNVSLSSSYSFAKSDMISLPAGSAILPPNAPAVYDSLGKLNYSGWLPADNSFPFATLLQPYTARTGSLISNLTLSYQIIKGLTFRTSFGFTSSQVKQEYYFPISSQNPNNAPTASAEFGNNDVKNWIAEPQIEYNSFIKKGKLSVLVGATTQTNKTEGTSIAATGYLSDVSLQSPSSAPSTFVTFNYGQYKYAALFGRLNYNWSGKYIINLSGRRDGSSRFGPGKQYGNFGAVGLAWIFTNESWWKVMSKFVNFGKIRGSYGTTGSDAVGDYKYLTRWSSNNPSYLNVPSLIPTQHANPDYHWQVNRKLELAIDLGILNDRVNLSASWYRDRCNNQLLAQPLSTLTGFSSVVANSPAEVENSGVEFSLNLKVISTKNFTWSINSNLGLNHNKLRSYPNLELSPYAALFEEGKSLNIIRLLHSTGVDPNTGLYTFEDKNKDNGISPDYGPTGDLSIVDFSPKYTGGVGSNVKYKSLQLSFYFMFVKQQGRNALESVYPGSIANAPTSVMNHWQNIGDISNVARYSTQVDQTDYYYHSLSDAIYSDASFIRLQNVQLSYGLPKKFKKGNWIQSCNIFLEGQNLLLITNYNGVDPETQSFGDMPPAKIFAGGIQFTF